MPAPDPVLGRVKVVAFPVPAFENRLLRVLRDPNSAGYELLEEGTALGDCGFIRGDDVTKYGEGFLLCKIRPDPNTGFHEWYFLNPRDNEDAYNFDTAYDGEHEDFPIRTRSYLVLRSALAALPFSATDPDNEDMTLVAQKQVRSDDPVVDALFVGIQRVYQILPGVIVRGQEYDEVTGIAYPYTEQSVVEGENIGDEATYIKPESAAKALKRVFDVETIQDSFDAYHKALPQFNSRIPIPDVMTSIEVLWTEESGDGEFDSEWDGLATGPNRSISGSESGNAHGACAVMPELAVVRKTYVQNNVPTTGHFVYMPDPLTLAAVQAKMSAILGVSVGVWPVFQAEAITFVLRGGKASATAQASASAAYSYQDGRDPDDVGDDSEMFDVSQGGGTSVDFSPAISIQALPPMLHAGFDFGVGATKEQTANAEATAGWAGIGGFPSASASATKDVTVTGSVVPASRAATTPADVPTTGLFIVAMKCEPFKFDYNKVYVEILDAADLTAA